MPYVLYNYGCSNYASVRMHAQARYTVVCLCVCVCRLLQLLMDE